MTTVNVQVENVNIMRSIDVYLKEAEATMNLFAETMHAFFEGETESNIENLAEGVGEAESRCDSMRRDIEYRLFSSDLTSAARGDIYVFLDVLDGVPNKAEDVASFVSLVSPMTPADFHNEMRDILRLTMKCTGFLFSAVRSMFDDMRSARHEAHRVETLETAVDKLEKRLLKRIFRSAKLDMGEKILLREFLRLLCSIADRAEDAADRINVLAVKMQAY